MRDGPQGRGWSIVIEAIVPKLCASSGVTRVHASVRGQRGGHQHDVGLMQFRCPHLMGVLDDAGAEQVAQTGTQSGILGRCSVIYGLNLPKAKIDG